MPEAKITLYATSWCGDCYRVRRLLDKNHIYYTLIDIDRDRQGEQFVIQTNHGNRSVPTIVFEDGSLLVEPSNEILTQKLGIHYGR